MSLRVAVWMRRRRIRLVVAAILVGVTAGLAMGIVAGTRRTDSAPDRYTADAGGDPDLTITQMFGEPMTDEIAQLPGVESAEAIVFVPSFLVSPIDGTPMLEPNPFAGNDDILGAADRRGPVHGSGQPERVHRQSSMADGPRRAVRHWASAISSSGVVQPGAGRGRTSTPSTRRPSRRSRATLVGITETPIGLRRTVAADGVLTARSSSAHPDVGVVQTIIAANLSDGADPREVLDAVRQLPNGDGAFAVPTRVVSDSARRAVRFQVTALWLVSALSVLAAAVVIAQIVSRVVRVRDEERESMLALGWHRSNRAAEAAIEGGLLVLIAAPVSVVVAYAISSLVPARRVATCSSPIPARAPTGSWPSPECSAWPRSWS